MTNLLSVGEAAQALNLDPSRVRALASSEQLPALKVGNRWVIDAAGVAAHARRPRRAGRPISPANAWALLFFASGLNPDWVGPQARSRLRRALRLEGLAPDLWHRLRTRARSQGFAAHPGEIPYLLEDDDLVASGVSAGASFDLDLVSGAEAEGYISSDRLDDFCERHALQAAQSEERANARLRVVPAEAWRLEGPVAPAAAVALDLVEDSDPRSQAAGEALLKKLAVQKPPD